MIIPNKQDLQKQHPSKLAAIYIRLSPRPLFDINDEAINYIGFDLQEKITKEYCQKSDIKVYKIYTDRYKTGASINARPEFQQLLADMRLGLFNHIVVYNLSRFSRSRSDAESLIKEFEKLDVKLISCKEQIDTTTAMGKFALSILFGVNALERELTSEKTSEALYYIMSTGRPVGRPPIGYKRSKTKTWLIDEPKARQIRDLYLRLSLTHDNATELIKTSSITTKHQHLYKIIRNPAYIGFINYKHKIYFKASFPAIVSTSLWLKHNPNYDIITQKLDDTTETEMLIKKP